MRIIALVKIIKIKFRKFPDFDYYSLILFYNNRSNQNDSFEC